jgi:tRNA A-37 threonylcarbamoyl transferase component Bud32
MLVVGDTLDKYRITSLLGQGGMGAVYAAENTLIGKKVAVKVLHSSFSEHEEVLQRFLQEARNAAAVEHPGIVEIFDFGWAELRGLRAPYLVMELLRGRSLADHLKGTDGRVELDFAVEVTLEVLSVLMSVHNKNIIHRDLKPENIFLCISRDGARRVKILDFGISKVKSDKGGGLTLTGTVLGTPYYMSPEQAHGVKDLDHRVDIWAMGAILYQMLTGKVPFEGDSYNEILSKIISRQFRPPRALRPELPEWIESVTLKALAWERDERYRSSGDFAGDLRSRWETFQRPAGAPDAAPEHDTDPDRTGTVAVPPEVAPAQHEPAPAPAPPAGETREPAGEAAAVAPSESAVATRLAGQTPAALDSLLVTKATPHRVSGPPDWAVGSGGAHLASNVAVGPPDSLTGAIRRAPAPGRMRLPIAILGSVAVVLFLVIAVGTVLMLRDRAAGQDGVSDGSELGTPPVAAASGLDRTAPGNGAQPATGPDLAADDVPTVEAVGTPASNDDIKREPRDDGRHGDRGSKREPVQDVAPQPNPIWSLDRAEVAAGIRSVSSKLKRCIAEGGPAPPIVSLSIQVGGDGSATFLGAQPAAPAVVSSCLGNTISRVRFRATGAPPITVSYAVQTEQPAATPAKTPVETPVKGTKRLKQNPFDN